MSKGDYLLFSGTSHVCFAEQVARSLGVALSQVSIKDFPDGEIGVRLLESVRGQPVFVIQTIAGDPNFYFMELLILIDALKRGGASQIVAVIPYYGYARQDRRGGERGSVAAKLIANLLVTAGISHLLTMDLHAEQIEGFFDVTVDILHARGALTRKIKRLEPEKPLVVGPDNGSSDLARFLARDLQTDFVTIDKHRASSSRFNMGSMIGDMRTRDVILVDDICSTGKTLKSASFACKKAGARKVFAAVTHPLFALDGCSSWGIDKFLVTDTVPLLFDPKKRATSHVEVVSVAALFGQAIDAIAHHRSLSEIASFCADPNLAFRP